MSDEEIDALISTAMLSPMALNTQNWRFAVIQDD
jgi:nitroreductase